MQRISFVYITRSIDLGALTQQCSKAKYDPLNYWSHDYINKPTEAQSSSILLLSCWGQASLIMLIKAGHISLNNTHSLNFSILKWKNCTRVLVNSSNCILIVKFNYAINEYWFWFLNRRFRMKLTIKRVKYLAAAIGFITISNSSQAHTSFT